MNDNVYGVYEFADSSEFYALSNPLCSARDVPGWGCDEFNERNMLSWCGRTFFSAPYQRSAHRLHTIRLLPPATGRDVNVIQPLGIGGLTTPA